MKHTAFLRAINVGGRTAKMAELISLFEAAGLTRVETFLASGNVIFEAEADRVAELHDKIERQFTIAFGYESHVFIRSMEEIAAIAACRPFSEAPASKVQTDCVGLTKDILPPGALEILCKLGSEQDSFRIIGRDIFWQSYNRLSDPSFTLKQLERALGVRATFRGMNTMIRLAARTSKACTAKSDIRQEESI